MFLRYFNRKGLETEPTAFDGRSDYGPFIAQDIPAGGLFSGAEDPKTAEQVAVYGGVEGEQLDPCYHDVCDTYESVTLFPPGLPTLEGNGLVSLNQLSDAAAHASWHFARKAKPLRRRHCGPSGRTACGRTGCSSADRTRRVRGNPQAWDERGAAHEAPPLIFSR